MNGNDASHRPEAWELPGYVHDRVLGAGASGRVVLARHEATGTPVAIKYLSRAAEGREAFRAEATLLGDLRSPHVAQLYEYVESGLGAAIVMELVDGIALRTLLQQEGATGPEAALVVLKGSLLGLAAAHAAGVVHRDYKPANVLVAADGSSKLVDFGVAVRSGDSGTISGTPAYMAPEQWAGRPASPAADVYAATVTFFECLTGAKPYGGTTLVELALQHTEAPIPDELAPDQVRPLIRKGLAKTPQGRPSSAAELVVELEAVAAAGYGEDWEECGQRKLAALVALLPLLLPSAGGAAGGGTTALATTTLGGVATEAAAPVRSLWARTGRRTRLTGGVAAAVLLTAGVGGIAIAGENAADVRSTVGAPAPELTTSLGPGASAPAPSASSASSASSSASGQVPPSASASVSATPTPSASASARLGGAVTEAPATSSATGGAPSVPGAPTMAAPPTIAAPPTVAGPTTASPTSASPSPKPSPSPAPALRILRVGLGTPSCTNYGISVPVTVATSGTGTGQLTIDWTDTDSNGRVIVVGSTTVPLPQRGTVSVTRTFGNGDRSAYWGAQSAAPAPFATTRTPSVLCNPPG
ncbi:hypothetical protein P3T37_002769 [Kitasatospora sp. MAA4]|uniref:serine/threonine-protein kinase n=1 Tax=Kitasatospora sp. MAA4 TaxID=3035093 RepID=UPI002474F467|nr:serine/threonine-protein kinase [Kitasatospora sp. MAA4]MDH6133374.1 hypothetical protein [Kitasatospora sp. MAA4]